MTETREGLTFRDLRRAAARGVLVAPLFGLTWALSIRYSLNFIPDFHVFFLQGFLFGLFAVPAALIEFHSQLRPRARTWHLALGVLLLAFAWHHVMELQSSYLAALFETGSPSAAINAGESSLSKISFLGWLSWSHALIAISPSFPFALAASGRLQRYTLPWQVVYAVVGASVLSCGALYLRAELMLPPAVRGLSVLDVPRIALAGVAALGLPLAYAFVDRLEARFSEGRDSAPWSSRTPLLRLAAFLAVGFLVLGTVSLRDSLERREEAEQERATKAEAATLIAQREEGAISRNRLLLAAHLGDPAARKALANDAPPRVKRLRAWLEGIERYGGREACVRASIAAGRSVLVLCDYNSPGDPRPRQALEAAVAQVLCPCDEHRQAAKQAASQVQRPPVGTKSAHFWAPKAIRAAARDASSEGPSSDTFNALDLAGFARSERSVRRAVRRELIPWALGREDPLAADQGAPSPAR